MSNKSFTYSVVQNGSNNAVTELNDMLYAFVYNAEPPKKEDNALKVLRKELPKFPKEQLVELRSIIDEIVKR